MNFFLKTFLTGLLMLVAAGLSVVLKPTIHASSRAPINSLGDIVPRQFGEWKEVPSNLVQVNLSIGREGDATTDNPYDDVLMRTYLNSKGQQVMLALAYGKSQLQEVKIHRPELCYTAQGYSVHSLVPANFFNTTRTGGSVAGKNMTVMSNHGGEAVSYWIRIGNIYSRSAIDTRLHIFKEGLAGRIPDGILVRASQRIQSDHDAEKAWPILEVFLNEMIASLPADGKNLIIL